MIRYGTIIETHAHEARFANVQGLSVREAGAEILIPALRAVSQSLLVFDPAFAETVLRPRPEPTKSATDIALVRIAANNLVALPLANLENLKENCWG